MTQQNETSINKKPSLGEIEGFIDVVDTEPTHKPMNFWDSLKIYNGYLYYYNYKNNTWYNTGP